MLWGYRFRAFTHFVKGKTVLNFGDIGKMGSMLKQAMEVKAKMEQLKETLGDERVEGQAGGGMVQVVLTGKMELISIKIDPEIINPSDPGVLETLIQAAFNEGIGKAQDLVKSKMTEMTGGIDIPGLTS